LGGGRGKGREEDVGGEIRGRVGGDWGEGEIGGGDWRGDGKGNGMEDGRTWAGQ